LLKAEVVGQWHEMIWIAIHHLRMRTAHATKNPVALLEIDHLTTYLLNGTGDFHSHDEGQFLATVITRTHATSAKLMPLAPTRTRTA
jgi:hypothetical protein